MLILIITAAGGGHSCLAVRGEICGFAWIHVYNNHIIITIVIVQY